MLYSSPQPLDEVVEIPYCFMEQQQHGHKGKPQLSSHLLKSIFNPTCLDGPGLLPGDYFFPIGRAGEILRWSHPGPILVPLLYFSVYFHSLGNPIFRRGSKNHLNVDSSLIYIWEIIGGFKEVTQHMHD